MTTTTDSVKRSRRLPLPVGWRMPEAIIVLVVATAVLVEVIRAIWVPFSPAGLVVALMLATALGILRRSPEVSLVLCAAAAPVSSLLGWEPVAAWSAACFMAYVLAVTALPWWMCATVIAIGNLAATFSWSGALLPPEAPETLISAFVAILAALIGELVKYQRRNTATLEARARDAVVTRQAILDRGIAEERVRIARDLHDGVGHRVAVAGMHLAAAEIHLGDEAATRNDLNAARSAIQDVLAETQHILKVLRMSDEERPAPTPAHTLVPSLVAEFQAAGIEVEATLPGITAPVEAEASIATYRIVEEALTNAYRHGEGPIALTIEETDQCLQIRAVNRIRADNDTPAHHQAGSGRGISGMKERAVSLGGDLTTRTVGRLYWLEAALPIKESGQ